MKPMLCIAGLLLTLTACGSVATSPTITPIPATATPLPPTEVPTVATEEVEATEQAGVAGTLTHTFDMNWGGQMAFDYPADWRLGSPPSSTIFGPDGYNISISASNNPNEENSAERLLDRMNQSADIEAIPLADRTLYITPIRGGNGLGAGVDLPGNVAGVLQMVNTRGNDVEALRTLLLDITASIRIVE